MLAHLGLGGTHVPPLLLRASIEFTLTKCRLLLYDRVIVHHINEEVLLETAFVPRVLCLTVERRCFPAPWDDNGSTFSKRLAFDVAPYPPLEAWQPGQHNMLESMGQHKSSTR
ncbi:hypothetical protein B0H17DRAFT_1133366 [Mycena rosella]|uniref:Uncharacterized protein n=1 Tax=Mycena rosella TaxID=1033263 RepID=A0AAD7DIF6_MYCRO|nr:hypothetical protein B0H17DRAFT_1133366 [Mycena rosella]